MRTTLKKKNFILFFFLILFKNFSLHGIKKKTHDLMLRLRLIFHVVYISATFPKDQTVGGVLYWILSYISGRKLTFLINENQPFKESNNIFV